MNATLVCDICDKTFSRKDSKVRHMEKFHNDEFISNVTEFPCNSCDKVYQYKSTLQRHIKESHPGENETSKSNATLCSLCDESFGNRKILKQHVIDAHSGPENSSTSSKTLKKISCPDCSVQFHNYKILTVHLIDSHNYEDHMHQLTFSSMEEFTIWKERMETSTFCSFVRHHTAMEVLCGTRYYFVCHRSGYFCPNGKSVTIHRRATVKINASCPARMVVTHLNDKVTVEFHDSHFGHECNVAFLKLTKMERHTIGEQLKKGVSFERILDDTRDSVIETRHVTRRSLLERRDMWNMLSTLGLRRNRHHKDDAISVDILVQNLSQKSNCPVLLYKPQGVPCKDSVYKFSEEDFMLVLSTSYQREVISKFLDHRVLVDSTHGTNGYDFQLTSIVTIDDFGCGVPVAYCLSNRIDMDAMVNFFSALKHALNKTISAEVFMSDCAEQYYNAWKEVMGPCTHHLYCTWHVDRSWRAQLKKIKDREVQLEVYKMCRVLLTTLDPDKFSQYLDFVLGMLLNNNETKEFGKYFSVYYAKDAKKWAYCYRVGLGLNTNMYLEALHKKIKYSYMNGKIVRRVDECISIILKMTRDIAFERLIRQCKGNNSFRQSKIVKSHKESNVISDEMITKVGEGIWEVKSVVTDSTYTVSALDGNLCLGCHLSCPMCRVCKHQFSCTCTNHLIHDNICKHIHACVRKLNEPTEQDVESAITIEVNKEINNIMETLERTDEYRGTEDLWGPVATRIKLLLDNVDSNLVYDESLHYLNILSRACNSVDAGPQLIPGGQKPLTPCNKNIDQQRRQAFHSTKKKKNIKKCEFSHPTQQHIDNTIIFFEGQSQK